MAQLQMRDPFAFAPDSVKPEPATTHLTGVQKAAIIVRVLLAEKIDLPIANLPPALQTELTRTIGTMRLVDRSTMQAVLSEFADLLEQVGIGFPDGMEAALALLDGRLDERAARQVRAISRGIVDDNNPWAAVEAASDDDLVAILQSESTLVGAVMLSRLSVEKSASLLGLLPAPLARDLALAVARTDDLRPEAVDRIGAALSAQLADRTDPAFATPAPRRVGAILNTTPPSLRDQLLGALDGADADFAAGVRKVILTFEDLPNRLAARDVPTLMRVLDPRDLSLLITAQDAQDAETLAFLLDNMSKRMADSLREEAGVLPRPSPRKREAAIGRIMSVIRTESDEGRVRLRNPHAEGEEE